MNATELYSETLATLNDTRNKLLSPEWQAELDNGSKQERIDASKQLRHVQAAISSLSNAILSKIATQMCANENALKDSTAALKTALDRLDNVGNVLSAITTILGVVAKVVTII